MKENNSQDIQKYILRRRYPNPFRSALLVIDMQNYFLPIADSIMDNVISVITTCREQGIKVIYTRHGHKDIATDGGMLWQWWGESVIYGSNDWSLFGSLPVQNNDLIIDKKRYSAFHGTKLSLYLQALGLNEIIITGVLTNCCCETTARDAFIRDYRVFFMSDATATINQDLHLSSLKNLAFGFAYVLNKNELMDSFGPKRYRGPNCD